MACHNINQFEKISNRIFRFIPPYKNTHIQKQTKESLLHIKFGGITYNFYFISFLEVL